MPKERQARIWIWSILAVLFVLFGFGAVRWWDRFQGSTSIDFYGKVVDQDRNPLPRARVTLRITCAKFFSLGVPFISGPETGDEDVQITSDDHGDFRLTN